jgi:hypothetical protein
MQNLEFWQIIFSTLCTVAATSVALLFIFNTDHFENVVHDQLVKQKVRHTLILMILLIFESLAIMIRQNHILFGVEICALSTAAAYVISFKIRSRSGVQFVRIALGLVCGTAGATGGVLLILSYLPLGVYFVAISFSVIIFILITNAWLLVREIRIPESRNIS